MAESQQPNEGDQSFDELARRAAEFVRAARPRVERLLAETRPVVEQATQRTLDYVHEHEDELREAGLKLARLRFGALGAVVDAFTSPASATRTCPNCQAANPQPARFCNQCGAGLAPAS